MATVLPLFWLFLSFANSFQPPAQHTSESADQIARQADQARTSDRLNEAITLYSGGVRLRPTWKEGWWWLGSLLYDQDRFVEAQDAFSHFVKLEPRPGPAYAFLALCEYEKHDFDRALSDFQMWSRNGSPGNDALLDVAGYHWALLLTRSGQFQRALYLLAAKAKKLGPTPELSEGMGLASLRMTWLPGEYPPEKRELIWLAGEAAVYAARYDSGHSAEFAHRLEIRYPQQPNVHYFLGTLLGFQNKFAEAAEQYRQELTISTDHLPALIELAMAEIRNFDPTSAAPVARRAVQLDPANARARYALGKALVDVGQFRESIAHLETARRLAASSSMVRSALATAYRHEGRLADAKREAAAFLALQDKEELLGPLEEKLEPHQKKEHQP